MNNESLIELLKNKNGCPACGSKERIQVPGLSTIIYFCNCCGLAYGGEKK